MWDEKTIEAVWNKAEMISKKNEESGFRKDQCGAWIRKSDYGSRDSKYGWEIDHITPESKGGTDSLSNLRPLHWGNNASRQDGRLSQHITAKGKNNVNTDTGAEL